MDMGSWAFPTDVLVEILLRLPPSSRRRLRLVCRHWRDVVNDRTTEMQSRPKALLWNTWFVVGYVVDDVSSFATGSCRELWRLNPKGGSVHFFSYEGPRLVGTCNGLLCLCYNGETPGGTVSLVNPATGEPALAVPPLPCAGLFVGSHRHVMWDRAYSFAYHPTTGRYKVVHVPCRFNRVCKFDAVQVLTLGDAASSWRDVPVAAPTPGGSLHCNLDAGIISVDGATHWVTEGEAATARVVSFDLGDDRITSAKPLPALVAVRRRRDSYHLTEVRGRLGVAFHELLSDTTEVWVLEDGRWSRRYSVRGQRLARPHFAHGEYVLTCDTSSLYAHRRQGTPSSGSGDVVVEVSHQDQGTLLAQLRDYVRGYRTFAYVETTEPLSVYAAKNIN